MITLHNQVQIQSILTQTLFMRPYLLFQDIKLIMQIGKLNFKRIKANTR